jgi:5-methylcytosine-specific restriction endonuclease McrA
LRTHICEECGKEFRPKRVGQICCCGGCSKKRSNKMKDTRIYQNGKPDLSISLTRLYMRDIGVCALCGKHIDFDCDSNSAHYPSIDHIIPLSKGGLHSWDNVQLACRECNTRKSNKT